MKLRERIARFMVGRNGADQLNRALLWLYLICVILSLFNRYIMVAALLVLAWMFFRIFSKNIYKRRAENQKYLRISGRIAGWFRLQKRKIAERKTHRYRRCPHCRATVRLPYRKGKHTVCCPKCRQDFDVKI